MYKDIALAYSKVELEDHWLVNFIPSMAEEITFLKFKNMYGDFYKTFGSDATNINGRNKKERPNPDLILYWNFVMTDEAITTTRQIYSWLDNISFLGGTIDFIIIMMMILFAIYNYKHPNIEIFYDMEKMRASSIGKSGNAKTKFVERYSHFLSLLMFLSDIKNFFDTFTPEVCKCNCLCSKKKDRKSSNRMDS